MTQSDSGDDGGGTAADGGADDTEDLTARVDRLETLVEKQKHVIDAQRDQLAELLDDQEDGEKPDQKSAASVSTTRRSALAAGGLLALLGLGTGTAGADPQGQVGTSSDPLTALYTQEVNSGGGTLTVNVGGNQALLLGSQALNAGNVVHGHSSNGVFDGAQAATIAGGGYDDGFNDHSNEVYDNFGTVAGGEGNRAGHPDSDNDPTRETHATVGGGKNNTARGLYATVSGGIDNEARGERATVGGGKGNSAVFHSTTVGGGAENTAEDSYSTVSGGVGNIADWLSATVGGGSGNIAAGASSTVPGGSGGKAADHYSFVFNDDSEYHDFDDDGDLDGLSSSKDIAGSGVTGHNTFHVSAQGGFRFITGSNSVTFISGGSTGWATASSRTMKTNVDPVDPERVLRDVEEIEVATWEYKNEDGVGQGERHIGPMAEDFHEAVDVGNSDEHINSINADGVLFAAVQGLSTTLDEKDRRIDDIEAENEQLRGENECLRERLDDLEERITNIEDGIP